MVHHSHQLWFSKVRHFKSNGIKIIQQMHCVYLLSCCECLWLNCCVWRLGCSKKGWTDGEIGAEWIKNFNEQTREKAKGWTCLLLVDGYNSHYTCAFLEYARAAHIHILCYPAHGTHVYQGLDVAVFSVLKLYWMQEKDKWEREKHQKLWKLTSLLFMVLPISVLSHRRQ